MSAQTDPKNWRKKGIKEKLLPYIGSGVSRKRVAAELDCSTVSVWRALKALGASL